MNNLPIQLDTLKKDHPQLKEKALVDFINGLEVIDDHIRVREKTNNQFFSRIWSDLTGETALRQNTIDQHVNESLKAVSNWLQVLQYQQIESDLAITKVAEKLLETRKGVMRLQEKHNHLAEKVEGLLIEFSQLDNKVNQLSEKILQVDSRDSAAQHLESVFDKWEAGRLNHYPVMIRLYLIFDELYWGDFGHYCRHYSSESDINRLIQQAKDKAIIQLKKDMALTHDIVWSWQDSLAHELKNLPNDYQQLIAYLSDDADENLMPMLWAMNHLASGSNHLTNYKKVPIILTIDNAVNHFAIDFGVRNAQQRN
ncbi:hypothetical protein DOJK_01435 [Patescibacteria group bacterium]|nr:hypothetical protein DOJK_01435 [Patescibacteria group bacterium]